MLLPTWNAFVTNLITFGTGESMVSLLEKVLRPVAVYVVLVWALRFMGKRILAQLNPFDLVVLLMLSNTVQNAIIGNDTSLSGGLVGAAALLGVNATVIRFFYRGPGAEHRMRDEDDNRSAPSDRRTTRSGIPHQPGRADGAGARTRIRRYPRGGNCRALSERHDLHEG